MSVDAIVDFAEYKYQATLEAHVRPILTELRVGALPVLSWDLHGLIQLCPPMEAAE